MLVQFNAKTIRKISVIFLLMIVLLMPIKNTSNTVKTDTAINEKLVLPIIMYHEVKTFNTGKDVITPSEFENDLKYLTDNHYNSITMTQLIDYVYYNIDLPPNPIILSFDDGYLN